MKQQKKIFRNAIVGLLLSSALFAGNAFAQQSTQTKNQSRGGRDPFVKYKPPAKPKAPDVPTQVVPPTIQERIARYKAQKLEAMSRQLPAPKPTTALLFSEMQIVGIFRTPRGYAAMVEATPIKLSYVIYPGEAFYDGQLVAIEDDRLVFRQETRWSNGKVDRTVETKPLRQADAVTSSMTSNAGAASNSANTSNNSTSNNSGASREQQRSSTQNNR